MKHFINILILLVILPFCNLKGQNKTIDSLKQKIESSGDEAGISVLNNLASEFLIKDPDKSIQYSQKALSLANAYNDTNALAESYLNIGYALRYKDKLNEALDSLYQTVELLGHINHKTETQIINLIGVIHQDLGHDTLSMQDYLQRIKSNKEKNYVEKNIKVLEAMSDFYMDHKNYQKALVYAAKNIIFYDLSGDTLGLIKVLNRVSYLYLKNNDLRSARKYVKVAFSSIRKRKGNLKLKADISNNYGNILFLSGNYADALKILNYSNKIAKDLNKPSMLISNLLLKGKSYNKLHDYKKAYKELSRALELAKEHNYSLYIPKIYYNLALSNLSLDKYRSAEKNLNLAHKHAKANDYEILTNILRSYSELYERIGQPTKALNFHKKYSSYKDSLYQKSRSNKIEQIKSRFEVDKKEHRINLLQKDSKINALELSKRKARNTVLIIGIVALVVVLFLIGTLYRNKLRTNKKLNEQNHQIKEQNEELNIINERLAEAEKRLQKSNTTKDKFFSIIAHDIKNPLVSFKSIIFTIKSNYNNITKESLIGYLDQLNNYTGTTIEMLNNLLMWARSQEEEIQPEYNEISLNEKINKVVDEQKNAIEAKQLKLRKKVPDKSVIKADGNMLEFIFRNVLSNSIKFCKKEGNIDITLKEENTHWKTSIEDNGLGIDAEDLKKIKKKQYFTKPGTEKEKGTGLGLPMCFYMIHKLNGDINIKSEKNKGTKIDIIIPKNSYEQRE